MKIIGLAVLTLFAGSGGAWAQTPPPPTTAPDYADGSSWLCRPGRQDSCAIDLSAMAVDASGGRTPRPFAPAADPRIDCFYVYPTVSLEPTTFADMRHTRELDVVVRAQAARFASVCRVYAPIYRQVTLAGLKAASGAGNITPDASPPMTDVRAAWRSYLAHDNHGRGVVLIGHSQGSMLLERLIAQEMDGKPDRRLLVSAILAGDPNLRVAVGRSTGGSFRHVPLCAARAQTGCVIGWSSYLEADAGPRLFGRDPGGGLQAVCVNPAAPAGGEAPLKGYLRKPSFAPAGDPPYVETVGQTSGACVRDRQGAVLRVRVQPGPLAPTMTSYLEKGGFSGAGWGLHRLDISLVLGDLIDTVRAQAQAWPAADQRP